jgi:hypothetical protein
MPLKTQWNWQRPFDTAAEESAFNMPAKSFFSPRFGLELFPHGDGLLQAAKVW